jgi:hypothetical protein
MTEVCTALDLLKPKLQEWVFQKYIQPIRLGQGKDSIFTLSDVYAVAIFMNLTGNRRHSRKLAGEMISGWVSPYDFEKIKFVAFFFEEKKIIGVDYKSEKVLAKAMEEVKEWDSVYIINFMELKTKVDNALKALPESE